MKSFVAPALALALLSTVACGPVNKSLTPAQTFSSYERDYHPPGPLCPDPLGTGGEFLEGSNHPNEVLSGYEYYHGSGCLTGNRQLNFHYRGAIRFDLKGIPTTAKFIRADLKFKRGKQTAEIQGTASNAGTCAGQLWTATSDWWSQPVPQDQLIPGTALVKLPYSPLQTINFNEGGAKVKDSESFSIDVRPALEAWVNQGQPNNGFVLVGGDEGFPEDNDNRCLSWYRLFVLDLQYDPLPE